MATIGEYNDWPAGLTLLLSLGTGLTVGRIGNQLIFERSGIEILRREIPEGGTAPQEYSVHTSARFTPKLYDSYDRIVELVDSEWLAELKDVNK